MLEYYVGMWITKSLLISLCQDIWFSGISIPKLFNANIRGLQNLDAILSMSVSVQDFMYFEEQENNNSAYY